MKLGVAGIGKMGAAIAARLIEVGHDVTVWNRTPDKAKAVAGAKIAANPAELAANKRGLQRLLRSSAPRSRRKTIHRHEHGSARHRDRDRWCGTRQGGSVRRMS